MKKNGFTLVELLAVVSIISLLLLLVAPKIVNQLNNSKEEVNDVTKKIIYSAAEKYIKDNNIQFAEEEIKCIPVRELQDEEYLSDSITDNKSGVDLNGNSSVKAIYNDQYNYELVDKTTCEKESGMLSQGLYPVSYVDNKWVVVSSTNKKNEWYDYNNQKWANAVTLLPGVKKEIGEEVKVDGTEASMMLVWVPRYEYKIEGDFGKGGTSAALPGEIEVNFIGKNKTMPTEGYHIHPAFTFGDKELSGIWVGKFELSHTTNTTNNINCTTDTCDVAQHLRILPDVIALGNNSVSNLFYAIRSIEKISEFGLTNVDTHMMKNSEWGAAAYLSQSKYGKYGNNDYSGIQKEIYINNSSGRYTGRSGGNIGGNTGMNVTYPTETTSIEKNNTYGYYTYDGYLLEYNTNNKTTRDINKGTGASTTGNIYGIYDMSGGSHEFVMSAYGSYKNPTLGLSDFSPNVFTSEIILPKYYDIYTTDDISTACNGICYGHALSETKNWYQDGATMVDSTYPWLMRGGFYDSDKFSGVFRFDRDRGFRNAAYYSTRVVFSVK